MATRRLILGRAIVTAALVAALIQVGYKIAEHGLATMPPTVPILLALFAVLPAISFTAFKSWTVVPAIVLVAVTALFGLSAGFLIFAAAAGLVGATVLLFSAPRPRSRKADH